MTEKRVLTAEETPDCPPHYWILDSENVGRCRKCPEVKDFGTLLRRRSAQMLYASKVGGEARHKGEN